MSDVQIITEKKVKDIEVGDLIISSQGNWVVSKTSGPDEDGKYWAWPGHHIWCLCAQGQVKVDTVPKGKY